MRPLSLACALLLLAPVLPAAVLANTDFSGPWSSVRNNPRAAGELPAGWSDNSGWANVWTNYSRQEEAGRPYLRVEVTRIDDGNGQLQHNLVRVPQATYIRLRMTVRVNGPSSVTFGIRRSGTPYNYLWQQTRDYGPFWREVDYFARIDGAAYDIGLYFLVNAPSTVDLAAFRLETLSAEEVRREQSSALGSYPKNLFRNTRLALGLPAGWMLDRDSSDDEVTVETAAEGLGLHLASPRAAQLYTEPFPQASPTGVYTASLSARGGGTLVLAGIANGSTLAQRTYALRNDWQRLSVTFTVPLLAPAVAVRLQFSGEAWADSFQVETGPAATAFEPPGACEVALAVDSAARVQFDDEPAEVRFRVTGGDHCAVLRARVEHLTGAAADIATLPLGPVQGGRLAYAELPALSYGPFRIEAWVEDGQDRRISPYAETVVYRLHRPRHWGEDAPDSPFGIHTNSTRRHALMAKSVGINWTRLHDAGLQYIGWYHLERKPSEWTFYDRDIERYREYNIKVLGCLSTAPEWASYFDRPRNGYYDRFYQPRNLDEYAHYVDVVARRYLGVIDAWDIWNEPWNAGWWAVSYDDANQRYVTSAQPQADFTRLQRTAFEAAKAVDPSLTILGVNSTTGSTGTNWTQGMVDAGALAACDVVCYHQYTSGLVGQPGDSVDTGRAMGLKPIAGQEAGDKPVWMTEGSSIAGAGVLGPGWYLHSTPFPIDEDFGRNSDRLVRFTVSHLAAGDSKVFLYSMHSHSHFAGQWSQWRTIVGEDGYLHPIAAAHSTMAWLLEDTHFVERYEWRPHVTAYLFENAERSVTVLAPGPGAKETLPSDALDLYGNTIPAGAPLPARVVYLVAAPRQ